MLFLSLFANLPFEAAAIIFTAFLITLVIGITVHEAAHAASAWQLGDPTAKLAGRLTLNPASHLDPIGSVALLLVGFGWGKPTPFDPFNLRHPKRDSAIISASGAVSNFLLAGLASGIYFLNLNLLHFELPFAAAAFIEIFVRINLLLGVFNLIPVHPLDGAKVLGGFLPRDWYYDWVQLEKYGLIILLVLIFTGVIGRIIYPATSILMEFLLPGIPIIL